LPFHPFLCNPTILKRIEKAIRPGFLHDEGELRELENCGYLWKKNPGDTIAVKECLSAIDRI